MRNAWHALGVALLAIGAVVIISPLDDIAYIAGGAWLIDKLRGSSSSQ